MPTKFQIQLCVYWKLHLYGFFFFLLGGIQFSCEKYETKEVQQTSEVLWELCCKQFTNTATKSIWNNVWLFFDSAEKGTKTQTRIKKKQNKTKNNNNKKSPKSSGATKVLQTLATVSGKSPAISNNNNNKNLRFFSHFQSHMPHA